MTILFNGDNIAVVQVEQDQENGHIFSGKPLQGALKEIDKLMTDKQMTVKKIMATGRGWHFVLIKIV